MAFTKPDALDFFAARVEVHGIVHDGRGRHAIEMQESERGSGEG